MDAPNALLIALLGQAVISGAIASAIWSSKGGDAVGGFLMGLFFGLVGLIFVAAVTPQGGSTPRTAKCPYCIATVRVEASVSPSQR